jgi:hypothetical protein
MSLRAGKASVASKDFSPVEREAKIFKSRHVVIL